MPTRAPSAFWSVLPRTTCTTSPAGSASRSATSRAASSLRRSAEVKASSSSARSRTSAVPWPVTPGRVRDGVRGGEDAFDVGGPQRRRAALGGAPFAAEPAQHAADRRRAGRVVVPGEQVRLGDRGQPPGERGDPGGGGLVDQVAGQGDGSAGMAGVS